MWLLTEDDELVNLTVFVAIRLEPSADADNLFSLVGVLSAGEDSDEDEEGVGDDVGDEAFVQLSPALPKGAADTLFNAVISKLAPVRVKDFTAPAARPQRSPDYSRPRQARGPR